jgi:hypothetical protein
MSQSISLSHQGALFLTMTNNRHFWVAPNSRLPMQTIKTMWKAIFQNKLTIYKANLPSFVQKIIKSRCYVDWSPRLRLKCHPKIAAWERLIPWVPPPPAFVGHYQLYLFPGSGICFLHVSPGVGNLLETKKSNIRRLFRYLTVLVVGTFTIVRINHVAFFIRSDPTRDVEATITSVQLFLLDDSFIIQKIQCCEVT